METNMEMTFSVNVFIRGEDYTRMKLQIKNLTVEQKLNEFVPSIDMQKIYLSKTSNIVTFSSFLEKIKNCEDAEYMWTNCNGNDFMSFKAATSTFISQSDMMYAGSKIVLDLSDKKFKFHVISELYKLLALSSSDDEN